MSSSPERFILQLPDHWTPEQALAVFELLNELTDAVWNLYELPLIELLRSEIIPQGDAAQQDMFDFDDTLTF